MKTSDFDYSLPPKLIAQTPIEPRDQARLMVLSRSDSWLKHRRFCQIVDYLQAGDVLVFNDSRVIPARLSGRKVNSGGGLEILLLRRLSPNVWETLVRPSNRVKIGTKIEIISDSVSGERQDFTATFRCLTQNGTRQFMLICLAVSPRLRLDCTLPRS